ncbi:MAG TPA: MMPL family transporter, partial [bacterium]|nr:MMPL family transporter [bacterium]
PEYDSQGKLKWISKIKKELYDDAIKWLNDEEYDRVVKTRSNIKTHKIGLKELPEDISKHFKELDRTVGTVVYVEQHKDYGLVKRDNLMDYSNTLREIKLPSGKVIRSSGEWIIFADLLESVKRDMPIVSILALLAICISTILLMGDTRSFFVVMFSLTIGVGCMLGVMAIFDIKLNFFNFIAIPITLGIGVDYSTNIYTRFRIDGFKNFDNVILNTGAPVLLCSLTTQISYIILASANNQALASFGLLSEIGEITCIFTALFITPVFHNIINKYRRKS